MHCSIIVLERCDVPDTDIKISTESPTPAATPPASSGVAETPVTTSVIEAAKAAVASVKALVTSAEVPVAAPVVAKAAPKVPSAKPVAKKTAVKKPAVAAKTPVVASAPPAKMAKPSAKAPAAKAPAAKVKAITPPAVKLAKTLTAAAPVRTANLDKDAIMKTDKTHAMFTDMNDRAKGAMEKGTKMVEDMTAFGKDNIEAMVESSKLAAKGMETLGQDAADYAKTSFESAAAAFKTFAAVKSPTEFMTLQSDYARTAFDTMIAESSRSTEKMMKMFGEIAQPISNRVSVAAEKMKIVA